MNLVDLKLSINNPQNYRKQLVKFKVYLCIHLFIG